MNENKANVLRAAFKSTERDFPDQSIEFLIEVTRQRLEALGTEEIDAADIVEAIATAPETEPTKSK